MNSLIFVLVLLVVIQLTFAATTTTKKKATPKPTTKKGAKTTTKKKKSSDDDDDDDGIKIKTPKKVPLKYIFPENYDELYVSAGNAVYYAISPQGTNNFGIKRKLTIAGLENPQGLALCGKPTSTIRPMSPYLIVADKGDKKAGGVYRVQLKRSSSATGTVVTAGTVTRIYGKATDKVGDRQPTDVLCAPNGDLYIADQAKGKIKKTLAKDLNTATCKGCDGDDFIADECEGATDGVKSMTWDKTYLWWSIEKSGGKSNGIWRKKHSTTIKDGKCTKCKGATEKEKVPSTCGKGAEVEFFKPTEDPLYGVAVTGNKVFYSKGEDKIKYAVVGAEVNPKTMDSVKTFKKATYIVPMPGLTVGSASKGIIITDKDAGSVSYIASTNLASVSKVLLSGVAKANGVAYHRGPKKTIPNNASSIAVSVMIVIAFIAALF